MKKVFIAGLLMVAFVGFVAPVIVSAQDNPTPIVNPTGNIKNPSIPIAPVATQAAAKLENPLSGVNSLSDLFYKIVNFFISFSYVIIAFFLILSGFKFVLAQGSETELDKAKQMFYYTIIGAVIIIGAQTITTVVRKIIEGLQ